jgi:transcriptional regulator with XRE-family HTH domain
MEKNIRIRFAKRLRQLRLRKGWTQEEVAEYADLAYRHVQRLESSKTPPPAKIDTIEKLAKAFKITLSKLMDI